MATISLSNLPPSEAHKAMFDEFLNKKRILEKDFEFLRMLEGRASLVIDIGANIGAFSLAAAHLIGDVDVIAFEPNVSLRWFLEGVRDKYSSAGHSFEFHMVGLSDSDQSLTLYIPKVQDWYVIGEASMDREVFSSPKVIARLKGYSKDACFKLDEAEVRVCRFDDMAPPVPRGTTLVVKIDVEGFEPKVLRGMPKFIQENKPIFFVENSRVETVDILKRHGYGVFDYDYTARELRKVDFPHGDNGIFIHPSNRFGIRAPFDQAGD